MNDIPKGRMIDVRLTVIVPETVAEEELSDWLGTNILNEGGISLDNPLIGHGIMGKNLEWEDTHTYEVTTIGNIVFEGNSTSFGKTSHGERDRRNQDEIEAWECSDVITRKAIDEARQKGGDA